MAWRIPRSASYGIARCLGAIALAAVVLAASDAEASCTALCQVHLLDANCAPVPANEPNAYPPTFEWDTGDPVRVTVSCVAHCCSPPGAGHDAVCDDQSYPTSSESMKLGDATLQDDTVCPGAFVTATCLPVGSYALTDESTVPAQVDVTRPCKSDASSSGQGCSVGPVGSATGLAPASSLILLALALSRKRRRGE